MAKHVCHICGAPATCIGEYETCTGDEQFACDRCCGHGNEDGHCRPVSLEVITRQDVGEIPDELLK